MLLCSNIKHGSRFCLILSKVFFVHLVGRRVQPCVGIWQRTCKAERGKRSPESRENVQKQIHGRPSKSFKCSQKMGVKATVWTKL